MYGGSGRSRGVARVNRVTYYGAVIGPGYSNRALGLARAG